MEGPGNLRSLDERSCHLLSLLNCTFGYFWLNGWMFLSQDLTFEVLQKPADWICSASDVDKKKGRKLDPNEDLRNKGFKAREIGNEPAGEQHRMYYDLSSNSF